MGDWIPLEKKKAISLQGYFSKSILFAGLGIVTICLFWIFALLLSINIGLVSSANMGESEARQVSGLMQENNAFLPDLDVNYCKYIYVDSNGKVVKYSSNVKNAETLLAKFPDNNKQYQNASFVFFADGSYCLFTWNYTATFTNTFLNKILPSAEITFGVLAIISLTIFFLLYVKKMSKKFSRRLSLLQVASEQIAEEQLSNPIKTTSGIKEFDHILFSMENMRMALKQSLTAQWTAENQRKQEVAALAHDIKTPLTVINGNAELLLEDNLTREQLALLTSVHSAGKRAENYISILQQLSNMQLYENTKENTTIGWLAKELLSILEPLASKKNISIEIKTRDPKQSIEINKEEIIRALINIGDNAIHYANEASIINVSIQKGLENTTFSFLNSGPNFTDEGLKHATEMFWQQDKSRGETRNYGIGLAFVAKVAEKYSGWLKLENTEFGVCVTFIIQNK